MKTGKTLIELATALQHTRDNSKDFMVPVEKIEAKAITTENRTTEKRETDLVLSFKNGQDHEFRLNSWSRGQLASYTDIPKAYFDRIAEENPELAAKNINHGLAKNAKAGRAAGKPETRMIRTSFKDVRGFLSDRYRRLDAPDLLETVLPVAQESGLQVVSSELTLNRLYLQMLSPRITSEIKKGDVVQYGLTISTSDVGAGSVRVEPLIYRLVCSNGLIADTAFRKYHIGRSQTDFENIQELLSDRTKEVTDAAFWLQVKDLVIASLKPENFEKQVNRLRVAADMPIRNLDLPEVVELTMKAVGITGEGKKNSILAALASGNQGAGLTQWGLVNSFTAAANADEATYQDSIDLQRAGGAILELAPKDWKRIADSVAA